ncbi:hypothetical protein ACH5RR_037415 [Cinchona calisaya]|uniref:RNase H type-1 domain-containing protein n=1 Tax=Cinchona calisaya TaxID=153742 RepID=A0ABD2Y7H9_9GENT
MVVHWLHPTKGYKLNVDGSSIFNPGPTGSGEILHGLQGEVIFGFSKSFGFKTSLEVEAEGLLFCQHQHVLNIQVEMDSLVLLNIVQDRTPIPWQLYSIIIETRFSLSSLHALLVHVYRQANMVADLLASKGSSNIDLNLLLLI